MPVADEAISCYKGVVNEVVHPRYRMLDNSLIIATVFAFIGSLIFFPSLGWSPALTALAGVASFIVIAATLLLAAVHVRYRRTAEKQRALKFPCLRLTEIELLKRLDIPCTVHWIGGSPHVEFSSFDDATLFKLARPPAKTPFKI
jgi:hypothetical protein